MEEKKRKWGGARPGSGRKPIGRQVTKAITVMLPQEEADILSRVDSRSTFVRDAIRERAALHPELKIKKVEKAILEK